MKHNNISVDRMLVSAHKRALLSAKYVRAEYQRDEIPIELMLEIHEVGGVYQKSTTFPGLKKSEVLEILPELAIPEECRISEEGWFSLDHPETVLEGLERAKEALRLFKEMARGEYADKTLFVVSHGYFLSCLYSLIINQTHDPGFIPHNNSLAIVDFVSESYKNKNGEDQVKVEPRLKAFNLQVIENQCTEVAKDFKQHYIENDCVIVPKFNSR